MNNNSISNFLIALCLSFTVLASIYPQFYMYGINNAFFYSGDYHIYVIQFFTGTFLHGNMMHFLMNAIFVYYFGNIVENFIGFKRYLYFFIFTTVLIGFAVTNLTNGNTVGISGFAMALLAYYTLELYSNNNPEYKGGITALVINVGIGFYPGISLVGHLFGAIAGIIFFLINTKGMNLVGLIKKDTKKDLVNY